MPAHRAVTAEVSHYLSSPRMAPYLAAASGDRELALALYQWNLQIGAALQEVPGIVEVVVRNAIGERLRAWNPTRGRDYRTGRSYPPEWTMLPAAPLAGLVSVALAQARGYAQAARGSREPSHPRRNADVCHDDILSQLTFGLWRKLLPPADPKKASLKALWTHALADAFPHVGLDPASQTHAAEDLVYDRLDRLVKLRNRAAHMEPLLGANIPGRLSDCMHLLGYVSPAARDWCAGISRVTAINHARPQP
ncbi:hypothetical protein ACWEQA_12955 [Nocardia sp. NPDC004085]